MERCSGPLKRQDQPTERTDQEDRKTATKDQYNTIASKKSYSTPPPLNWFIILRKICIDTITDAREDIEKMKKRPWERGRT